MKHRPWLLLALPVVSLAWNACTSSSSSPPNAAANDSGAGSDVSQPDAGIDAAIPNFDFSAMRDELFAGAWKTDGVVVMWDGHVVFEQYANGYDASKRHILYSASKSIGSALLGIAIGDGKFKLTDSVCAYVSAPPVADAGDAGGAAPLCDTTIENLVQMTSGLAWAEDYADPSLSNVLTMLYGSNSNDMGGYAAGLPRAAKAGTVWNYSSGDANLLAKALRGALGGQDMHAWAKQRLFDPAGLSSAVFEADHAGSLVFSSSCFMTVRDFARFGQLYLNGGSIDGTKVLPDGWVSYSITPAPPVATPTPRTPDAGPGNSGGSYGASWWLNAATSSAPPDTLLYPEAPLDAYSAEGHWGQKLFIVPSRKLVVARVGNDRDVLFNPGPMVAKAVAAVDAGGK